MQDLGSDAEPGQDLEDLDSDLEHYTAYAESYAESEPELDSNSGLPHRVILSTESEAESDIKLDSDLGPDLDSDSDPEAVISSESKSESEPGIDIDLDSDSDSESGAKTSPEEIAARLASHLLQFQGCKPGMHTEATRAHFRKPGLAGNHCSLAEVPDLVGPLPWVLDSPEPLKFKDPRRQPEQPINWAQAFEGRSSESEKTAHVCLHSSECSSDSSGNSSSSSPIVQFDFDSILGFANSLAFARQGLYINFVPHFQANIKTDVHLTLPLQSASNREIRVQLRHIPHYCLGRLVGQGETSVYILFPKMYDPYRDSRNAIVNFPTYNVLEQWTDAILLPAIGQVISADVGQHLPCSWKAAQLQAKARNYETTAIIDKSESRSQRLQYALQPRFLAAIWTEIYQLASQPGNGLFQGAQLYFTSKNTKLLYKGPTISKAWQGLSSSLDSALDFDYIDQNQVWVDLGKETICKNWNFDLAIQPPTPISSASLTPPLLALVPETFLWRYCCLDAFSQWQQNSSLKQAKKRYYTTALLKESPNMTLEMHKQSPNRKAGWIYSQFYGSYKERFDAAKIKPFENPLLYKLAWDPQTLLMLDKAGGARTATTTQLLSCYQRSKARLANSLLGGQLRSYGTREEHRLSLQFLQHLQASLESTGQWEGSSGSSSSSSSSSQDIVQDIEEDAPNASQNTNASWFQNWVQNTATLSTASNWFQNWRQQQNPSSTIAPNTAIAIANTTVPYWRLSTADFSSFLTCNVNKFLLAFEWILTSADQRFIGYEQSKVLVMLLEHLPYIYDSAIIGQKPGLWLDRKYNRRKQKWVQGIGLEATMAATSYGWILPGKIDWQHLAFSSTVAREIAYENTAFWDNHKQRWPMVRDTKDQLEKLEILGRFLATCADLHSQEGAIAAMIFIVLRSFRAEIFQRIQGSIRPECRAKATAGGYMLCWETLEEILQPVEEPVVPAATAAAATTSENEASGADAVSEASGSEEGSASASEAEAEAEASDDSSVSEASDISIGNVSDQTEVLPYVHIVDANRCKSLKTLHAVASLLWDLDDLDIHPRKQWNNCVFRLLHSRAQALITQHCTAKEATIAHSLTKRICILTSWLLPFPNDQQLVQYTKDRDFMWLSVRYSNAANMVAGRAYPYGTALKLTQNTEGCSDSSGEFLTEWDLQRGVYSEPMVGKPSLKRVERLTELWIKDLAKDR
jgi:hypothetical protein